MLFGLFMSVIVIHETCSGNSKVYFVGCTWEIFRTNLVIMLELRLCCLDWLLIVIIILENMFGTLEVYLVGRTLEKLCSYLDCLSSLRNFPFWNLVILYCLPIFESILKTN